MSSISAADDIVLGTDPTAYQVDYTALESVKDFHALPRFSRSNDFSLLFSNNPDDVRDYSLGLMFLAIFIISSFTMWAIAILLLKCIGPKYVGVFSGYPYQQEGCKATTGRSIYGLSALSIFVLAIVMVTKGLAQLQSTSNTIDATNQDAIKIHDEFVTLTNHLKNVSRHFKPVRDQLVTTLSGDICPLTPRTTTETTIRSIGNQTLQQLEDLDDFIAKQLQEVDIALAQVYHATTEVNEVVSKTQFTGPQATAIMFPYFVVPAFLLVAVSMGWFDVINESFYTFMTWIITPLMSLMTAFAFLACGWVILSVQGNSDFCYPTPEENILLILEQYGLQPGELYYDAAIFYTHQCSTDVAGNPWNFLVVFHGQLQQSASSIYSFLHLVLSQTPDQLSQECGIEYSPVQELLTSALVHTNILSNTTARSLHLLSCPTIVPLYTNVVYNATCENSIAGAQWCFSCLLLIAFFGMLTVMLRGAYFPVDYFYFIDEDPEKDSMYSTASSDDNIENELHLEAEISHEGDTDTDIRTNDFDENMMDTLASNDRYYRTQPPVSESR